MNNKRKQRKLPIFLGLGLGIIAASATTTLLALINKTKHESPVYLSINFDKGTGTEIKGNTTIKFEEQTTLDKHETPYPKKIVMKEGVSTEYNFVDWVDERGITVYPQTVIKQNTKLTATYSDDLPSGSYFNVSFVTLDPDDYFTGITKLSVPKGRTLASINKPQPHSKNENRNVFKGWALANNPTVMISQDTPINTDMVLTPIYSTTVKFKWNGNGGTLESGDPQVTTENNVKFGQLNQPVYTYPDKFIGGWYKADPTGHESEESWLENNRWKSDDLIPSTNEVEAFALWTSQDTETQTVLHFVQNESEGQPPVEYKGNEEQLVAKTAMWGTINRPNPYAAGYSPVYWEYYDDTLEVPEWTRLSDTFTFGTLEGRSDVDIRPVMQKTLDSLLVYGPTSIRKSESAQYNLFTSPEKVETNMSWQIFSDASYSQEIKDGKTTISNQGLLKTTTSSPNKIYIKVTPEIDKTKFATCEVTVIEPTVQSSDYFTYDEDSGKWLKLGGLFEDGQITYSTLDGTASPIDPEDRSTFNRKVWIGDEVRMVGSGFLNSCTNFNSPIEFASKNTTMIGDNFLTGCTKFNQTIDLSNIQHIGNYCLANCPAFNNGSTTGSTKPLTLTSILTIGDYFLAGQFDKSSNTFKSDFNCPITIGSSATTIGDCFLWNALTFNSGVNFPVSLKSVGDFCMYGCDNYKNIIKVDANVSVFSDNYQNFCSVKKNTPIHENGFKVSGDKRNEFISKFPAISQDSGVGGSAYRLDFTAEDSAFATASWTFLLNQIEQLEKGEITEDQFCDRFTLSNGKKATKLSDFNGQTRTLTLFGKDHSIRVEGTGLDNEQLGGGKNEYKVIQYKNEQGNIKNATFVFSFANCITDSKAGGRIFTWNINAANATDYLNSSLRKTISGNGNGSIYYQKNKSYTLNTGKSIFAQMPTEITNAMKTPLNRECQIYQNGAWQVVNCPDKLFIPTFHELCGKDQRIGGDITSLQGFYWTAVKKWGEETGRAHRKNTAVGGDVYFWWTSTPANTTQCQGLDKETWLSNQNTNWTDFMARPYFAI